MKKLLLIIKYSIKVYTIPNILKPRDSFAWATDQNQKEKTKSNQNQDVILTRYGGIESPNTKQPVSTLSQVAFCHYKPKPNLGLVIIS